MNLTKKNVSYKYMFKVKRNKLIKQKSQKNIFFNLEKTE